MTIQAKSWSFSGLTQFEKCPYATYLKLTKAQLPEADEKSPLIRGIAIHELAEAYVKGELPSLPKELKKFDADFEQLREKYTKNLVEVEGDWAFTATWDTCDWKDFDLTWLRVKLDVLEWIDDNNARVIDHKTGHSYGKELPHNMQGQLYAIAAFMRFPKIKGIEVVFWYLDEGKKSKRKVYDRKDMIPIVQSYEKRASAMLGCTYFKAKPNLYNCKWCAYGVNVGSGACPYAIDPESL